MRANKIQEAFGQILREKRVEAGLSQESLALEAKVDRTFVSQIERGIHQPTLTTLYRLAEALGVRGSSLLGELEKVLE